MRVILAAAILCLASGACGRSAIKHTGDGLPYQPTSDHTGDGIPAPAQPADGR